jgi:hypothetical protein
MDSFTCAQRELTLEQARQRVQAELETLGPGRHLADTLADRQSPGSDRSATMIEPAVRHHGAAELFQFYRLRVPEPC